jgi:hypothetical protein
MNFSFTRWNLSYHEALFTNFSFTMESRLSQSPFHEFFFHNGNFSYHEAFHTMEFTKCTIWGRLFSYISQRVFT